MADAPHPDPNAPATDAAPAAPDPAARTADEAFERCRGVLDSAGINDNMRREVVKRLDDHVNGRG